MRMQQLIYASQPFGFDAQDLANILAASRLRNMRDDITGALICRSDVYLQLLEGPTHSVEEAFERIRTDDRHINVRILVRASVQDRLFPDWRMRHDPARSRLWTRDEVHLGALEQASARDIRGIFLRLANS